jgi:hypothetical protein
MAFKAIYPAKHTSDKGTGSGRRRSRSRRRGGGRRRSRSRRGSRT